MIHSWLYSSDVIVETSFCRSARRFFQISIRLLLFVTDCIASFESRFATIA